MIATSNASSRQRAWLHALREALHLFWLTADAYAKRRWALAVVLVAGGALLAALTPVALKMVVDHLSEVDGKTATALMLVLVYVAGQYMWRCSNELRLMVHGHADQRLRRRIGSHVFNHLIRMPMRFHLERKAGAMGETAEQGLRGAQMVLQHLVYTLLPVTIEFATVASVLVYAGHPLYLSILVLSSVAYVFCFHRWAKAANESAQRVSATHIDSHALLTDALVNAETVKYFDAERAMAQRYDIALSHAESAWRRFFTSYAMNGIVVATIFAASLGCSLVLAMRDVASGAMTLGDFVLVNAYIVRLVQPLELLGFAARDIAQGLAFLSSMLGLLRQKPEVDTQAGVADLSIGGGQLAFVNVSFGYREERAILKDVSFTVPARGAVAIVGVSGSGKSSLVRLLFRLYEPDRGHILLDGVPISDMRLSDVRRSIAVVPQDTVLFHDTIARNIGFGRLGADQSEIEEAARIANLHDFVMSLPEQYETIVGERGLKLSGGERQRVAIARAALKRPRIFVFDEATSSLDSKTEREILRNLVDLSSYSTALVIAHRLSTIVHADEIIVLNEGRVVERGTHAKLIEVNGQYAALWNAQQSGVSGVVLAA